MACSYTLSSYSLGECFSSQGGIKTIWLAPYVEDAFTIGTGGTVTDFNSGVTWLKQEVHRNSTSLTSTLNADDNSGSNYVVTEATIVYRKMDKENRMNANAIAKSDMIAVVRDANDTYFALGVKEPVRASAGTGETGTDRADSNRYELTIQDYNPEFPPILDSSAVEKLS